MPDKNFELSEKSEIINPISKYESELLFHSQILENISEGVYLVETNSGNIVYCNPAFEKMFGYESGELLGKNVSAVYARTDKSPEDTAVKIISELNKTGVWKGEVVNKKKDGTVFYCIASVSSFNHPKYGTVWVSMHTDISAQRQIEMALQESEARNKLIVDHSHDWEVYKDKFGKIIYSSPAFERFTDYKNEEYISGKINLKDIIHPDDLLYVLSQFEKVQKGHPLDTCEFRILRKDKSIIYTEAVVQPVFIRNNELIGFRTSIRDIM